MMPGVQKPHCRPWCSTKACCTGWSAPSGARPSIVVTSLPSAWSASRVQLFTACPSTSTVQAPHWLVSQPTCAPVSPSPSRRAWTSSVRPSTSSERCSPFTVSWTSGTRRHGDDVGDVEQSERQAHGVDLFALVLDVGEPAPDVASAGDELADLLQLLHLGRTVPFLAGVEGEPEDAERVLLAHPEQRRGHREVAVDPREDHRLREDVRAARRRRLERRGAERNARGGCVEQVAPP